MARAVAEQRILVVEDEYLLAFDLADMLRSQGLTVLGPASAVDDKLIAEVEAGVDAAVLDLHLVGGLDFSMADRLWTHGVPFAFATGYDVTVIPKRFAHITRFEKPYDVDAVVSWVQHALGLVPQG